MFFFKFDTSHIETEQYYINILLEDLNYPFSKQVTEGYFLCSLLYYDYFPYGVLGSATIDNGSWLFKS